VELRGGGDEDRPRSTSASMDTLEGAPLVAPAEVLMVLDMEAPPQAASPQPDPRCKVPFRLQSIVVAPSVKSQERQLSGSCSDTRSWKKVKSRSSQHHASSTSSRLPRRSQLSSSTAFLNRMHGRCFRCLASDHKVAVCRDPPKCFYCSRSGHLLKDLPS
jgi:hypothetical protein